MFWWLYWLWPFGGWFGAVTFLAFFGVSFAIYAKALWAMMLSGRLWQLTSKGQFFMLIVGWSFAAEFISLGDFFLPWWTVSLVQLTGFGVMFYGITRIEAAETDRKLNDPAYIAQQRKKDLELDRKWQDDPTIAANIREYAARELEKEAA